MVSNHVEQLRPGQGCYAFFLNAQGRILGDVNLLCLSGAFLLDLEPELRQPIYEHLDRYIIADDVVLEDVTGETAAVGVEGPEAETVMRRLGAPVPDAAYAHQAWGERLVAHFSTTGQPGFTIIGPRHDLERLVREVEQAGPVAAGPEAARTVRLENGKPRYGDDFNERALPHETQLLHAVHFNKGCYLGQEIVERVRSRGGVHRFLTRLAIDAAAPPTAGTRLMASGREVGEITSAAWSPAERKVVALGYLRRDEVPAGAPLTAAGARAEVLGR